MACLRFPAVPQSPHKKKRGEHGMDARTSRYHEVYAHWQRDPEGFWAEAAPGSTGTRSRKRCSTHARRLRPLVRRRVLQHLLQRARPPHLDGRNDQPALIYDSPRHQHHKDLHLRPHAVRGAAARRDPERLRRREGRPRHHLYADDAGGGVRHARLRAHRRHPLGWCSAASPRRSSPPASTTPSRRSSCPPHAASSRAASSHTSRCSTRRSTSPSTSRRPA